MRAAGLAFDPKTGRGGWPHEIDFVGVVDTWDQQVGEIWQQQLARIGIRLRHRPRHLRRRLERSVAPPHRRAHQPRLERRLRRRLELLRAEPELGGDRRRRLVERLLLLRPRARRAARASAKDAGPAARRALYAEAERIVADRAPWVPAFSTRALEIWQPYLKGYQPHPFLPEDFRGAWIDDATERQAMLGALTFRRHPRVPR